MRAWLRGRVLARYRWVDRRKFHERSVGPCCLEIDGAARQGDQERHEREKEDGGAHERDRVLEGALALALPLRKPRVRRLLRGARVSTVGKAMPGSLCERHSWTIGGQHSYTKQRRLTSSRVMNLRSRGSCPPIIAWTGADRLPAAGLLTAAVNFLPCVPRGSDEAIGVNCRAPSRAGYKSNLLGASGIRASSSTARCTAGYHAKAPGGPLPASEPPTMRCSFVARSN